ncbi:MAG: SPOR domain-containing protein [Gammaproteobacteria bacterium]|nr:SPOR domain-containing protein [Gammaproteobacteria bacterium]
MDDGLKKRLIGATVLVSLIVIFVPMLLQREPVRQPQIKQSNIPLPPQREFRSNIMPLDDQPLAQPPPEIVPIEPGKKPPSLERRPPVAKPPPTVSESSQGKGELTSWVIQVGSFSDQENAERLVNLLREKEFSTSIQQETIKGNTLYRVLIGPEIDRKQADILLKKLDDVVKPLGLNGLIKSYP